MERSYPLSGGLGRISVREEGERVVCQVELDDDGRGLYRAWLLRGEERFALGAVVPEEGTLRLRRILRREDLCLRGLWPPTGGAVELICAAPGREPAGQAPPKGWEREPRPGLLLEDHLLARSAEGLSGALLRRTRGGFQLAMPYVRGKPFPLPPLFCFAQVEELEGAGYAVFSFDQRGRPVFPHKGKGVRKE